MASCAASSTMLEHLRTTGREPHRHGWHDGAQTGLAQRAVVSIKRDRFAGEEARDDRDVILEATKRVLEIEAERGIFANLIARAESENQPSPSQLLDDSQAFSRAAPGDEIRPGVM